MFEELPAEEKFHPVMANADQAITGMESIKQARYTRADVMKKLLLKIPTNELGLPFYIYRTDLIPGNFYSDDYDEKDRVGLLNNASLELDYHEGFPSQANGTSFWAKLDFEPIAAFTLFIQYLGVVQREDDTGRLTAPVRTYSAAAELTGLTEYKIKELSLLYYWSQRAKAHDLFMVANFQKQKETRALLIEDGQFRKTSKWIKKAEKRLEEIFSDEDELMEMKPKEVFLMLKDLMGMQRVSAGLPAGGPAINQELSRNATVQTALKEIAANAGEEAKESSTEEASVESMLGNPEALLALQDMIIKINEDARD